MGNLSELLLDEIKKGNVQQILKEKNNIILQENKIKVKLHLPHLLP